MAQPVLLDITRSVTRRLTSKTPSGIDRVCDAYAAHFAGRARAVLQFRGRAFVLRRDDTETLLTALDAPLAVFRRKLFKLLTRSMARPVDRKAFAGSLYLNVSHSDFDLDSHWEWIQRRKLQPVYLVHDLIPLTHPEVTTNHKTLRHRGRVLKALRRSAGIIVNSASTAAELKSFAGRERLSLPPVLTAKIAGAGLAPKAASSTTDECTFVSVGTLEKRKNHKLLLEVWSGLIDLLGEETPRLILAGGRGHGYEAIAQAMDDDARLANYIDIRSGLDDAHVASLVSQARALLLPSLAEGYGLPLVEALEMGVPVIASDLPSFRELGQDIATLLDPKDVKAWQDLVYDHILRGKDHSRQTSIIESFEAPSWEQHFAKLDPWLSLLDVSGEALLEPDTSQAMLA